MNPKRMKERCPDGFSNSEAAILKDYRLAFNKTAKGMSGVGYANVMPQAFSETHGVLYTITDGCLAALDRYEGTKDGHYIRVSAQLETYSGQAVAAWIYIASTDKTGENLKPTREYLEHLLSAQDLLKAEYVAKLRAVTVVA